MLTLTAGRPRSRLERRRPSPWLPVGLSVRAVAVVVLLALAGPRPVLADQAVADYEASHSRYGWKAVCASWWESRNGDPGWMWNSTPWAGDHAKGYFGWLNKTFYGIALWGSPGNLDAEIEAFDRMLDADRGGEFFGLGGYGFRDGTGPCYRRAI